MLILSWLFFRSPASNIPATGPSTLTLKVDVVGVGRMGGAQMPSHWVASVCDGWGDEAARLVETGECCWRVTLPETLKLTFLHFLPLKNRPLTCQKETRKYSFWHPFSGAKMWASGRVDVFRKSENLKESYKTFVVSDHLSLACALVCTEGSGTSPVSQKKGYEVVRYENKLDAGN